MEKIDLFAIPLFKFKFEQHEDHKQDFMEEIMKPGSFDRNTRTSNLFFTDPNLHKKQVFQPFKQFVDNSLNVVMDQLGYEPNIEITGMWATHHKEGGFHHRHIHSNSFLAGVYYLHGNEKNSGTTFHNPCLYHQMIVPKYNNKPSIIRNSYSTSFDEGYLYIFPAWLSHNTGVNNLEQSLSYRTILSFNSMPVGMTMHDEFDRYNFQSIENAEMISYKDQRVLK